MILLDGLDKVARQEDRGTVAAWVERQISSYPGNHFVITSRPHGFPGPVIAHADVLAVRPFTAEQVQQFLNRWYLAARTARYRSCQQGSECGPCGYRPASPPPDS